MLTAHIEIPKGGERRTYLSYDKTGYVDLGLIRSVIPVNDGVMPIPYGFIVGTINHEEKGEHPEELDVLIYTSQPLKQGDVVPIEVMGLMRREDKDDKIIARVAGETEPQTWEDVSQAERDLITSFFGHKSKILSIENKDVALEVIRQSMI